MICSRNLRLGVLGLIVSLSACASTAPILEPRDSAPAPETIPNIAAIPDAVPKVEPRSRYGNPASYEVFGRRYTTLASSEGYVERGVASWYGTKFHGRRTSSGEPYDMYAMTAAHKTLPLPTYVEVTNLDNGRRIVVRVNDRGPFVGDRLIDLSYTAAIKLGIAEQGTGRVEVRALQPEPLTLAQQTPAPTAPRPSATLSGLFLQVGAFSSAARAEAVRQQLGAALGQSVLVMPAQRPDGPVYRVRIGPLQDQQEGLLLSDKMTELGFPDSRLILD